MNSKYLELVVIILVMLASNCRMLAQKWVVDELEPMPQAISNNSVVGHKGYVYSFSGIDNTKIYSGISNAAFKYDISTDTWSALPDLPDDRTKIAAAASVVKDKIYIIGGYTVLASGNEISSAKTHVFNTLTDRYETDGLDIPIPIDDQVQAVYRDSLIYVVTGWSNSNNVTAVQVYDPAQNTWSVATPLPANTYRVFGASGTIVGDTLYYLGGAANGSFAAAPYLRKGYINPNDPMDISWEEEQSNDAIGYRAAASVWGDNPIWFGGSSVTYNFDGIAYNGSGGVEPNMQIINYDRQAGSLGEPIIVEDLTSMDLRGIAKIGPNEYLIAGGMTNNQTVTSRTLRVSYNETSSVTPLKENKHSIWPTVANQQLFVSAQPAARYRIIHSNGSLCLEGHCKGELEQLDVSQLSSGIYYVIIEQECHAFTKR